MASRLAGNPKDELSFHRLLRTADGIGRKLSERIWKQLVTFDDPSEGWSADGIADSLPKRAARSWDRCRRVLIDLQRLREKGSPAEQIDRVLEGVYRSFLRKSY